MFSIKGFTAKARPVGVTAPTHAKPNQVEFFEVHDQGNLQSQLDHPTHLASAVNSFGVGFRRLDFTLNDGQTRTFGDSTANGIGFHISYVEPERALEYERQISPVSISKEIQYQGKNYNSLEVIQNNIWYWWATPLSSRWWSHYGSGFQFAQIRPIAEDQTKTYLDESSLVFGGGLGWFAVPSLLLSYRFTLSFHLSTMGISEHDPILPRSQVHTIYFDYFYAL